MKTAQGKYLKWEAGPERTCGEYQVFNGRNEKRANKDVY